jgi:hypothetical protein
MVTVVANTVKSASQKVGFLVVRMRAFLAPVAEA